MSKQNTGGMIRQLIQQLQSPPWKFWASSSKAARELGALGDAARDAVPHLVELVRKAATWTEEDKLDKKVVHGPFADALVKIGSPALDSLMSDFAPDHEGIRYSTVEIVARFGKNAVPKLIAVLRTGTKEAKANAAWAIASIGSQASDAVPALNVTLGEALKPDAVAHVLDRGGRITKVEVRKEYTEADIAFLESLHSHKDPKPFQLRDHDVIIACLAALGAIGSAASEAVPTVEYALKVGKDDIVIKCAAEHTLQRIRE